MSELEKDARKEKSVVIKQMGCTVEGLRLLARMIARCHRARYSPRRVKAIASSDNLPSDDLENAMLNNKNEMLTGDHESLSGT